MSTTTPAAGGGDQGGRRSLAEKLNFLFGTVRPSAGEREYTGKEVVAAVREAGTDLSASHLSELRRGLKTNPTLRVLQALAGFFQVRVGYFFDDPATEAEVEAELALRSAMHDAQVYDVALRAAELSSAQRQAFQRLLGDIIRKHGGDQPGGS